MDFTGLLNSAAQSLLRNKSRSLLTTVGVVIGVSSVILLVSIGNGLKHYIAGQFEGLGSNIIIVLPANLTDDQGRPQTFSGPPPVGGKTFTMRDAREVQRLSPAIDHTVPLIQKRLHAKTQSKQKSVDIVGSTFGYMSARSITMAQGSFYSEGDVERGKRVAVLGPKAANEFFPGANAIGKTLHISSVSFEVIGITNPRGAGGGLGVDLDDQVYVPISSLQKLIDSNGVDFILVKTTRQEDIEQAINLVKGHFTKVRKPDSFSVIDQRQILGTLQSVISSLTIGLGGIAAISLLVGGIGVMNMMLISVTERTREIGLRKALGATPNVILVQFLLESIMLTVIGGMMGIMIGISGSLFINRFFPASVSLSSIAIAFGVSATVGIIFGLLPARRAARLSPINALRYE